MLTFINEEYLNDNYVESKDFWFIQPVYLLIFILYQIFEFNTRAQFYMRFINAILFNLLIIFFITQIFQLLFLFFISNFISHYFSFLSPPLIHLSISQKSDPGLINFILYMIFLNLIVSNIYALIFNTIRFFVSLPTAIIHFFFILFRLISLFICLFKF